MKKLIFLLCLVTNLANAQNKEEDIDKLIEITGLRDSISHMTDEVVDGFDSSVNKSGFSQDTFTYNNFESSIKRHLAQHYEPNKYKKLIQLYSSKAAQAVITAEAKEYSEAEIVSFYNALSEKPLSKKRINLLRKVDKYQESSKLSYDINIAMVKAIGLAYAEGCEEEKAKTIEQLENNKDNYFKASEESVLFTLAYQYEKLSDLELNNYLKFIKDKNVRWFNQTINTAIKEEYLLNINDMQSLLSAEVREQKKDQSMFKPKCGDRPDITID